MRFRRGCDTKSLMRLLCLNLHDTTQCSAIGTLPGCAAGAIQRRKALGTMSPHSNEWQSIRNVFNNRVNANAPHNPSKAPMSASLIPSLITRRSTSPLCAPIAIRTPISRVRCVTVLVHWPRHTVRIPPETPPGRYFLSIMVDQRNGGLECRTANNLQSTVLDVITPLK